MKKTILCVTAAALILASAVTFAGCGSDQSSDNTKTTSAASQAETKAESTASQTNAVIAASDVVFNYNGASVELNTPIEDMIAAIGEASNVESQLSCHGEGEDKTYTYDGFTVNSYPLDGKDMVMEIVVNAEGIPTSKGISVGSTADDVVAAYGSDYKEIGIYYAYEAGDKKSLQFMMEDGTVKEIDYYYSV